MKDKITFEELQTKIGYDNYLDFLNKTIDFRRDNKIELILDETETKFEIWMGEFNDGHFEIETFPQSQRFVYFKNI